MTDFANPLLPGKDELLASAPNIWPELRKALARQIAEALVRELSGEPSNRAKLIAEELMNTPWVRQAA